jgi:hypothetical protein
MYIGHANKYNKRYWSEIEKQTTCAGDAGTHQTGFASGKRDQQPVSLKKRSTALSLDMR